MSVLRLITAATMFAALSNIICVADTPGKKEVEVYSIVDTIIAKGECIIEQPRGLASRLRSNSVIKLEEVKVVKEKDKGDEHTRYSVQIFSESGSNGQNAARSRCKLVEQRMPGMKGEVFYDTPFWTVRIGNFRTEAEANAAMRQLKSRFPSFAGEMRIVRSRVKK